MNTASLNVIRLNVFSLNESEDVILGVTRPASPSGDIPAGYEAFLVGEGVFSASDGAYYVKL